MDEKSDCPLCMDPLELDDIGFYPCDCGYQICRFCWTRIINEENGLCPACRQTYNTEKPAFFKPISNEELYRMKKEKKKKEQLKKGKSLSESRKHLADLRVVQTNLIFVVGIPIRLSMDVNLLSSVEYFGRYGKIFKLVVNHNNTFVGPQGQQCVSAYVTYKRKLDAMRALLDLNKRQFDSRQLKVSLGTTKYCSQFLKGVPCTKAECMYLHELGEDEASFTKEEMQQGKHTEYEQKLIAEFVATNPDQLDDTERIDWEAKPSIETTNQPNKSRHDSCCATMQSGKLSVKSDLPLTDDFIELERERKRIASLNIVGNIDCNSQVSPFLTDPTLSIDTNCTPYHSMSCWTSATSVTQDVFVNQLLNSDPPSQENLPPYINDYPLIHTTNIASIDIEDEEHAATYDFDPFRESQEGLAELIEKERTMYNAMLQQQQRQQQQQQQQQQMNSLTDSLQSFNLSQGNNLAASFHRSFTTDACAAPASVSNHFYHSAGQPGSSSTFMHSNSNVSSSYPPAHNNYMSSRSFPLDQAAQSYNSQYLMPNRQTQLLPANSGSVYSGYSRSDQSSSDSQNFSQFGVNNQFHSSAILDFPNSIKHPEDLNMQEFHDTLRSILPHANISIKSPPNNLQQDFLNMSSTQAFTNNDFPNSAIVGKLHECPSPLNHRAYSHIGKEQASNSWLTDDPAIVGGCGANRSSSMQDNFGVPMVNLSTNQKIPSPNQMNSHPNWNGYSDFAPNQFPQKYMQQGNNGVNNNGNLWPGLSSYSNYLDSNNSNFNSGMGGSPQPPVGSSTNYRSGFSSSSMYQNGVSSQNYSPNFPL